MERKLEKSGTSIQSLNGTGKSNAQPQVSRFERLESFRMEAQNLLDSLNRMSSLIVDSSQDESSLQVKKHIYITLFQNRDMIIRIPADIWSQMKDLAKQHPVKLNEVLSIWNLIENDDNAADGKIVKKKHF